MARQEQWTETVNNLDFKTSSRKAWSLSRKLGPKIAKNDPEIHPDRIASHVVSTSRAPRDRAHSVRIKHELKALKANSQEQTEFSRSFTVEKHQGLMKFILHRGKPNDDPKSYRPIALLSTIYKLFGRLLFNRIGSKILENVPIEQAGFRPKRSYMSLTTHIEAGSQDNLKK
ncbi:hypothetical protein JTB14_036587 [Gonioctena quinquepunctata]|nr:hypothetical protein JTB14_036587 [Gonioctena quinquepunctata]